MVDIDINHNVDNKIKKIRQIHKLDDTEISLFFKKDIYELAELFEKDMRSRKKIIGEICYSVVNNFKTKEITRLSEIVECSIGDNERCSDNFLIYFFENLDKPVASVMKQWLISSKEIGILNNTYNEFLLAAAFVYVKKLGNPVIRENKIIYIIQRLRAEEDKTGVHNKIFKKYENLGLLKIVDVFTRIRTAYMYDEEILQESILLKRKYNYLATHYGVFDLFELKCRDKFSQYYSENITTLEIENANKKYNFKWKKVNDTVFIESLIDDWYVMIDKVRGKMVLYHNNNIGVDTYHIQKVFRHTDLRKIFKTIHKHDLYSLERFDRIAEKV